MQQPISTKLKKTRGPQRRVWFYGERLKSARKAAGMTQEDVTACGVSLASIQRAERGDRVSYETAREICAFLRLKEDEYLKPEDSSIIPAAFAGAFKELSVDELMMISQRPNRYVGRRYGICVTQIGQAAFDDFIVNYDTDLATAAGATPGDTLRFQVASGDCRIYRVHADGALADRIQAGCDLRVGFTDARNLKGLYFIVECRGKYHELICGVVDNVGQREWALIWRLIGILNPPQTVTI